MTFKQLAALAAGAMHRGIVDQVPSLKRGRVWCHACGYTTRVDSAHCLATGWPTHCGQTMSIDAPWERKKKP
jgi:hypothetical protein